MRISHFLSAGAAAAVAAVGLVSEASASCSVGAGHVSCSNLYNANVAPTAPVAGELVRSGATTTTQMIGNHLQGFFSPRGARRVAMGDVTGMAAGDADQSYGLWASGGGTVMKNTEIANEIDGTLRSGTVGFDYMPSDNLVLGVSAFAEGNSLTTRYNAGSLDRVGFSLVPYAAYSFGQGSSVDVMVGATTLDADVKRAQGQAWGSYTGHRYMAAVNAHHALSIDNFNLRGDVGYTYAHEKQGSYTEKVTLADIDAKTSNLGQGKIGGRVGYGFEFAEPYVQAHYVRDFVRNSLSGAAGLAAKPHNDSDEVQVAVGFDWFPTATESIGMELTHNFFRKEDSTTSFMINARLRF